ncbi:MAG: hypothetical protein DRQ62_16335 [Gammaproteobacteria bacterium]|nr:MAG: hypothetical protein DRQ62_16335 [Gammaproteobacteria bacterium]
MSQVLQKYFIKMFVCFSMILLSGCFELGEPVEVVENDPPTNPPPPAANQAPVISGNPNSTAFVGSSWAFSPSSADPDGDALNFQIQNKPVWTNFDAQTGRLSGMPMLGHEGSYAGIRITVNDGRMTSSLPEFAVTVESVSTNNAPRIDGNAPGTATVGQQYLFQPSASDPDGDDIIFSIANRPAWASFNAATGLLGGTPVPGDEAVYGNIVISVSDGEQMASLPGFVITVSQAATGSVTLTWTPPTTNTGGSPLNNLAAYKIYYGLSEGNYPNEIRIDNPGIATYVVDDLNENGYYFVSTSINADEVESDFSNVVFRAVTTN